MRKRPETGRPEGPAPVDDSVHLSPILGIRPGIYLCALYGLILLGIFFFLCLFPGLSHPGSLVSLKSDPGGAAIRIDGVNRGATPEELFLDRGPHRVEFVLPGFETQSLELEVPGRIIFSLFFPRRLELRQVLATPDPLAVLAAAAADYAAWSFTGEATASYQIPLNLSEGVYRVGPSLGGDEQAAELIRAAARFAVSQASLRDLGRAKLLLDNGGLAPSALSLGRSAADVVSWLSSAPGAASWLAEVLPSESSKAVRDSPWAQVPGQGGGPALTTTADGPAETPAPGGGLPEIAGLRFLPWFNSGGTGGRDGAPAFYYAGEPVGIASWEIFLEARPEWRAENLEALREQNLVNGDYLVAQDAGDSRTAPRTAVSWYAARAFCQWLTTRLPPGFGDWEVRLPREEEWEACFPSDSSGGTGLWEWCDDPYAPLRLFPAARGAVELVSSPERLLRNSRRSDSRGSLPPDLCSPFVGFRPFIALRSSTPSPTRAAP